MVECAGRLDSELECAKEGAAAPFPLCCARPLPAADPPASRPHLPEPRADATPAHPSPARLRAPRAALFDISTFAACFVSVILGLGGTLFLLGVFKKALPALPISIALGVVAYFMTRFVAAPMMLDLALAGVAL